LTFVSDSTLRGNSAGFGNGSAITSQANSFLALTDSDVTENVVTGNTSGPAILLDPDSFSRIIGGSIFGNTPNDDIGFSS